jgi:hypothetical protein
MVSLLNYVKNDSKKGFIWKKLEFGPFQSQTWIFLCKFENLTKIKKELNFKII